MVAPLIKSLVLLGWVKIFLPFPKGWRRVVTTQRHWNYGDHFRRRRGCVQTKTSEGGRIKMRADYYFFAPTGGRYQTVFRGTLPRRTASGVRGVVITRAMLVYYCRGDTTSSVRNVAITRWHHTSFHYLCGYAQPTYLSCVGTARR